MKTLRGKVAEQRALCSPLRILAAADGDTAIRRTRTAARPKDRSGDAGSRRRHAVASTVRIIRDGPVSLANPRRTALWD